MDEIRRAGSPKAIEKKGEGYFVFEVPLNASPDHEWVTFFGQGNISYTTMFVPKMVSFRGNFAQFPSEKHRIEENLKFFESWLSEANRLYADERSRQGLAATRAQDERATVQKEIDEMNERLKSI